MTRGPGLDAVVGPLDATRREATLDALEREAFDLIVIGGGITGAGVAREAALRGLRVALLEAADFAAGTSSRSSKLIHGGLRYLALGDVALVRETALERKVVFAMAPHLAERRWMLLPVASRAGLLKFRAAVTAYEKLGEVEDEDRHRNWSGEELAREEPVLDRSAFPHACAYREYLTDDARLVVACLRAAAVGGAVVAGHIAVTGVVRDGAGRAEGVTARCALGGRELRVRGRAIVNAAGPWVEAVRRLEEPGIADAPSRLHLSKGIHLGFRAEALPVRHLLLLGTRDKRSIFAIRRGQVTYVGTTDTSYEAGAELWPAIRAEDVAYLLEPIERYCDVTGLGPADVVSAWAGLRPLVAEPGKQARDLSRKDEVEVGPAGVVNVAGGKLTGFRPMAIRILEQAGEAAGLALPPRPHDEPPVPGGDFDGALAPLEARLRGDGIGEDAAARLVRLYGAEAPAAAADGAPLRPAASVLAGEVDWAVRVEGAARLEDVVYRRTRVALYEPDDREALLEPVAARMAALLGWTPGQVESECEQVRGRFQAELRFEGGTA